MSCRIDHFDRFCTPLMNMFAARWPKQSRNGCERVIEGSHFRCMGMSRRSVMGALSVGRDIGVSSMAHYHPWATHVSSFPHSPDCSCALASSPSSSRHCTISLNACSCSSEVTFRGLKVLCRDGKALTVSAPTLLCSVCDPIKAGCRSVIGNAGDQMIRNSGIPAL